MTMKAMFRFNITTLGFRVAVLPLRREFVQPAHFEQLVSGGTVEAGVGRNLRHGVQHRVRRLRVHFALRHVHRGLLRCSRQALWRHQWSLVRRHLGQNAGALVHGGVFALVQVADGRSRRRDFLFGFLWTNRLFSVGTLLQLNCFHIVKLSLYSRNVQAN